ncbi:HIT family protein [Isoptericola croceus]|uniref:HIT family protein n=1 Tax=Isoptericola croceus TaxID=3031406 RepID=UPI0023F9ECED|nr:HIT family protein [Isoptericola croceus]
MDVTHEPVGFSCPFCLEQRGYSDEWSQPSDIVAVTDRAYARVAPKWWPGNPGSALVIARAHVENLYALSPEDNHAVWDLVQQLAIAVRSTYTCEGTSIRQHNEPAGDQDLWHLHVHVFPRHHGDDLYLRHRDARWVEASERAEYATRLRRALGMPTTFENLEAGRM